MRARAALASAFAAAAVLLLLVDGGACAMYKVGDLDAWGVPPASKPDVYKNWPKSIKFKLGDAICKHAHSFELHFLFLKKQNALRHGGSMDRVS